MLFSGIGVNTNPLFTAGSPLKLYDTGHFGEKGVIGCLPDVKTGKKFSPSLADYYLAGVDALAAVTLDSQPLTVAVPSVYA